MKILLFVFIISNSLYAQAPKMDRSVELMGLINQEMRILESTKRKGADLQYRLLELHSEKLKLVHEKNNKEFLEKAGTAKVAKESFFGETRAYYQKTKEFGSKTLKDFPKTARKPEILFAMALNSRDYGRDNITEKYLLETISLVKDPHHSLRHHAETSLADFYYNEKRFNDAITYYKRSITKTEDEWLTKHLFNLSWCYLKVREFDLAINTIKASYFKSKEKSYVNMKDQTLENIGSFYVYAGRPMEGLDFYLENEPNPIPYLIPMSVKTSDKGHQKETESILAAAQKIIDKDNLIQHQEELFHTYMVFYRQYNRFADHEKVSRSLVSFYKMIDSQKEPKKLTASMKEDAIEKMRSLAGFLQIKVSKDMKQDESNFQDSELKLVLNFFDHLIALDSAKKVEYYYFRAETYYSVRQFSLAAPSYVQTVDEARTIKNEEYSRKGLNSLLALTGLEVMEKVENTKFLTYAYTQHTAIWPRDEKSEKIYPKLFDIYREAKDDVKATAVLASYNKYYPEHLSEQQTSMTKILDQFIEAQNVLKLVHWIEEFKKGFLAFSKDTIEKTELVLGNILFLQYQDLAKKGQKMAAAEGFESIYVHKLYPDKIKSQAAFFAALSYLEMGETVKSFHWQELAMGRMTSEERLKRREEQLKITERTYKLQDFNTAHKLSNILLKDFCSLKDDTQNRFYEISIMTALVEDDASAAESVIKSYSKCLKVEKTKDMALAQIYQLHEKKGDFFSLRSFIKNHPLEVYLTQYRHTLQKWFWERSNVELKVQIRSELASLKNPESQGWLKEMSLYEQAQKEMEQIVGTIIWNAPQFDGDVFNKSLEAYLLRVQEFKVRFQPLTQSSQIDLAILSTKLLSEVYLTVSQKIEGIAPQGMNPETTKQFQGAMKQVASTFKKAAVQYDQQLNKAMKAKETLTFGSRSVASVEKVENPIFSFFTGLTMDKGQE